MQQCQKVKMLYQCAKSYDSVVGLLKHQHCMLRPSDRTPYQCSTVTMVAGRSM
jgi:hypothetical protein